MIDMIEMMLQQNAQLHQMLTNQSLMQQMVGLYIQLHEPIS